MMGQEVLDPKHVEGDIERLPGLGLLPISTRMSGEKVTRQVKFGLCNPHSPSSTLHSPFMQGYEIHMGVTTPVEGAPDSPLNLLENGSTDGYYVDSTCMGTYIHGILDNTEFIDFLLAPLQTNCPGMPALSITIHSKKNNTIGLPSTCVATLTCRLSTKY